MSFSLFFQSLINGLNQGAIYALIALGYTMVYGIIRMINFAHGDFIMIGAYTLFYTIPLMVNAGMPAWLAVIVAIAVCAVVGVLVIVMLQTFHGGTSRIFENIVPRRQGKVNFTGKIVKKSTITDK